MYLCRLRFWALLRGGRIKLIFFVLQVNALKVRDEARNRVEEMFMPRKPGVKML
jgi:hypothetical protein